MNPKILLCGAGGRMGQSILRFVKPWMLGFFPVDLGDDPADLN